MKTYKTWEVIKMLDENKNLEFESVYKNEDWSKRTIKLNSKKQIAWGGEDNNHQLWIVMDEKYNQWTLVQQPATWEEVLKSDKRVRVEYELLKEFRCSTEYLYLSELFRDLSESFLSSQIREILINAKFYLEEGEE